MKNTLENLFTDEANNALYTAIGNAGLEWQQSLGDESITTRQQAIEHIEDYFMQSSLVVITSELTNQLRRLGYSITKTC